MNRCTPLLALVIFAELNYFSAIFKAYGKLKSLFHELSETGTAQGIQQREEIAVGASYRQ
jgi:hypothetical protein